MALDDVNCAVKIHYYNWTPKISPLDKWEIAWIGSRVFEEGANSSRHALRCLIPTTLLQLLGAFSSPRQINANSIPGSPGIYIGTAPYCYRLLLRLNSLTPNTTCPVVPMQAPPTNHITTTMQPRPSHGGFPGKPRTLSPPPLFVLPLFTYPVIPISLGSINHIATTTSPRPFHGGYPPSALHHATITYQPTVHTLALSKEGGGGGARSPPQILPTAHPPVTRTGKSRQFTLLNLVPRHQNYATPFHRGLPPGAATPPYTSLPAASATTVVSA